MTELQTLMDQIKADAREAKLAKQMTVLSTDTGRNRMLRKSDAETLTAITSQLVAVTDKPVYTGFTFSNNIETIIAIASTLQYMKGDLRDQVSEALWIVFDSDTRTDILDAYGRTPYFAEEVLIEVDGAFISVDPEAQTRAEEGSPADVAKLEALVNSVALELDLLGDYRCTQKEASTAWTSALRKVATDKALDAYKHDLA